MYLFILESIGTSELILIGLIALIVFGPRKLPQMAKTIGKTMADFRKTTQDFKSTWEKEVDFEEEKRMMQELKQMPTSLAEIEIEEEKKLFASQPIAVTSPEITEVDEERVKQLLAKQEIVEAETEEKKELVAEENGKRDWL